MSFWGNFFRRRAPGDGTFVPPSTWPIGWWQMGYRIPVAKENATVEACVGAITQTAAMLPLQHWKSDSRGGSVLQADSAVSRVLRRPNSYQTKADFILNLIRAELMTGNGYALATRNGRTEIDGLHLMRPNSSYPFVNEQTGDYFYSFTQNPLAPSAQPVVEDLYPSRDVLHIRLHTPLHPLMGESPLKAAALAVDGGNAIAAHTAGFFQNMSRPSGYLKVPGKLQPSDAEILRNEWSIAYKGVDSGKVAVLQNGLEWVPLTMSAVDAAIIQSYKMSNSDIARVFRVPLSVVGEEDSSKGLGNTEVLMKNWLATGLGFILEHVELALDVLFELPSDEWIAFDRDYLLQADFAARIDGLVKGVQGGVFSPNEARAREGLPSVEHGDQPRVQQQVVPLSYGAALQPPSNQAALPPPEEEEDEDEDEGEEEPEDEGDESEDEPEEKPADLSVTEMHLMIRGAMQ